MERVLAPGSCIYIVLGERIKTLKQGTTKNHPIFFLKNGYLKNGVCISKMNLLQKSRISFIVESKMFPKNRGTESCNKNFQPQTWLAFLLFLCHLSTRYVRWAPQRADRYRVLNHPHNWPVLGMGDIQPLIGNPGILIMGPINPYGLGLMSLSPIIWK